MSAEMRGIFPYLVSPLDEKGELREEVLADLVDHLIRKGVHGLTPLGSTGEGAYLDWPTKRRVVEVTVAAAAGRVPVVAGVNAVTTRDAVAQAEQTAALGVAGIVGVLPTYFPVGDAQVVAHFRALARAVDCPVTLYANPHFSQYDFTVDTLRELAEEPNIRYLKDASGNIAKLMSVTTALGDRIRVFAATAHVPVFVFMLGGVGWMAGPACLVPEASVQLYELAAERRWDEALALQRRLWPLNLVFQRHSLAACVKAGLELQGFPVGAPMAPQRQLDAAGRGEVRRILEDLGVLGSAGPGT